MAGRCAKAVVECVIVTLDGKSYVGRNDCANPQPVCPRAPGEDYTKCREICQQASHAEVAALAECESLGGDPVGGTAYMNGNTYFCKPCQEMLTAAGVRFFCIGRPPFSQLAG
jgi:deoxycytidylate deaminase